MGKVWSQEETKANTPPSSELLGGVMGEFRD